MLETDSCQYLKPIFTLMGYRALSYRLQVYGALDLDSGFKDGADLQPLQQLRKQSLDCFLTVMAIFGCHQNGAAPECELTPPNQDPWSFPQ